jgi:hypothetical protein
MVLSSLTLAIRTQRRQGLSYGVSGNVWSSDSCSAHKRSMSLATPARPSSPRGVLVSFTRTIRRAMRVLSEQQSEIETTIRD